MSGWHSRLQRDLDKLNETGLTRNLRQNQSRGRHIFLTGKKYLNLASNDYLGLIGDPRLNRGTSKAIWGYGTGSGASRLVTGTRDFHQAVEHRIAQLKHAEAGLLFPTGYMANLAVLTTLAGKGDLVCIDKLSHASLIDAARFSEATTRVYPHLRYDKLERLLANHVQGDSDGYRFVVSDSVFSMDGDVADLVALCDLAERYNAVLIIDEAHGTGVLGANGAGLSEAMSVAGRIDVTISTASKALGSLGGCVTAGQVVIDTLVNRARPFIYTTSVPPGQAGAIDAALDVIRDEPWRRNRLAEVSVRVRQVLEKLGWQGCSANNGIVTPIVPLIVGGVEDAVALSRHLEGQGIFAPAIRPPTVARGTSRVRLSLRADLTDQDVNQLLEAIEGWRAC